MTTTGTAHQGTERSGRVLLLTLGRVAAGLLVPLAVYYGLRSAEVSVYVALLISAAVSAVPTLVGLVRRRRVNGLSAYFTVMVVGSIAVDTFSCRWQS